MNDENGKSVTTIKDGLLSHSVNVLRLPPKGLTVKITPAVGQLTAISDQLRIRSVEHFEALLLVKKWHKDGVRVTGSVTARLVQNCVITLTPVSEEISVEINAVYLPSTSKLVKPAIAGQADELIIDPDGEDTPEIFDLPELDIGAIAVEFVALELNPYPKADNAEAKAADLQSDIKFEENIRENPFASLAALKDKL
ncbi:MAG: DUF177 domain-containing protein [Ahrensia sp.]|nr:DUF177 domain-containing protein [Ahrensia sp.]